MIYEFMATQDLHGYAKPWAPGTGKNLFDESSLVYGVIANNGNFSPSSTKKRSDYIFVKAGTYTASRKTAPEWWKAYQYADDSDKTHIGFIFNSSVSLQESFTLEEDCYIAFAFDYIPDTDSENQLEAGATATAYEPYSNICPPEGFNIWDPDNDEMIQVYAGYVNANTRELYLRPVYKEYAGEELVGPWMSSLDEYSEDATPTEGAFVIDFGGELESFEITPFMLQTLLESLGIRQHFTDGASLLNKLMDQAQGRVRSEEELLHLSRPLNVIAIGDQLPAGITFKPISKDVLPGLPGKFIR